MKPFVRETIEGSPAKRVGLKMVRRKFVFLVKPDPVAVDGPVTGATPMANTARQDLPAAGYLEE